MAGLLGAMAPLAAFAALTVAPLASAEPTTPVTAVGECRVDAVPVGAHDAKHPFCLAD